jgi:Ca2+-binding EF-hand superfamily protein
MLLQPYVGSDGSIEVEKINTLLTNIGCSQQRLTKADQQLLLKEAGSSNGCIEAKKMMELIS